MTFHIPFTISSLNRLKIKSKRYVKIFSVKRDSKLKDYLAKAEVDITREEYLGIVARSTLMFSIIAYIAFSTAIFILKQGNPFLVPLIPTIAVGMFTSFSQINYPKILADKQQKGIERNLLAAMEDMLIQLSSGVPLFTILVNVSASGYGQLSLEFKKAVKKINAGFPQIEVIEELGKKNHSILFRKALWQISNGMKAGSNITEVVRDIIHSLNEEQFETLSSSYFKVHIKVNYDNGEGEEVDLPSSIADIYYDATTALLQVENIYNIPYEIENQGIKVLHRGFTVDFAEYVDLCRSPVLTVSFLVSDGVAIDNNDNTVTIGAYAYVNVVCDSAFRGNTWQSNEKICTHQEYTGAHRLAES